MMNRVLVLVGFSASGKDTLLSELVKIEGFNRVVSHTTRPMRDGEVNGVNYYFCDKSQFDEVEFLETREYNTLVDGVPDTWYYGLSAKEIEKEGINVVILDLNGLIELKEILGDKITSIFLNASEETRLERCKARGDYDETEFNRRLADDREQFPMERVRKEVNYVIESSSVVQNVKDVISLL